MRRARPAARRRPQALEPRARGLAAGAAGGRAPPRARDRLAGGEGAKVCSGDTDEGFPGREEGGEEGGGDKGWGRRGPCARSPEPRLFPRRGGGRRGRRGPVRRAQDPDPLSEGTSAGPLEGGGPWGPPTPSTAAGGQRGRGTAGPSSGLGTQCPDLGPAQPRGELGLCRRARPRPRPSARSQGSLLCLLPAWRLRIRNQVWGFTLEVTPPNPVC